MGIFHKITGRLILLVFIVLIPFIILQSYRIQTQYDQRVESELSANVELAKAISTSFMNYLETVWHGEEIIGQTLYQNPSWDGQRIEQYLNSMLSNREMTRKYIWLGPDGRVIASTDSKLRGMKLERDYIDRIVKGEDRIVSSMFKSQFDGQMTLPVAAAVRHNGALVGIMAAVIDTQHIDKVLPSSREGIDSRYGLADNNGQIVFETGMDLMDEQRQLPADSPVWGALEGRTVKTYERKSHVDNSIRFGVDYPIKNINWVCYVTTSLAETLAPYQKDAQQDILILILVSLASVLAAIMLGRMMLKPILAIKETAMEFKRGNISARTRITGGDELSSTAEIFDQMINRIEIKLVHAENFLTVGEMAASITHEVRNPMTAVRGFVQLLMKEKTSSSSNMYFGIILEELDRANQIIGNFLAMAKPVDIDEKVEHLNEIVADIQPMINALSNLKGITTVYELQEERFPIQINKNEIKQVIINLTRNAMESMDKNGILTISTSYDKNEVQLIVSDTGCGIPEEQVSQLFNSFFTTKKNGTGLGLTICKSIVERNNGSISVTSEEGVGTAFTVTFYRGTPVLKKK
jgi:signal transduction histidine kinase